MSDAELSVRLFLLGLAVAAFTLGASQAGWRHQAFITALFAISVICLAMGIWYPTLVATSTTLTALASDVRVWFGFVVFLAVTVLVLSAVDAARIRNRILPEAPAVLSQTPLDVSDIRATTKQPPALKSEASTQIEIPGIPPLLGPPQLNLVAVRAETEIVEDPREYDPANPDETGYQAMTASFHNQPLPDAKIGTGAIVTASISYEIEINPKDHSTFEFAQAIKAVWLTSSGDRLNHVNFNVNSVRRLLLARNIGDGKFAALEHLADEVETRGNPAQYAGITRVPLEIPFGDKCTARVRFIIDGQAHPHEYRFVLNLGNEPSCCREEDDIDF